MNNENACRKVIVTALKQNIIERHQGDVFHDVRQLSTSDEGMKFAWLIYNSGTHLVRPIDEISITLLMDIHRNFAYNGGRWFWFDGVDLVEHEFTGIVLRLCREIDIEPENVEAEDADTEVVEFDEYEYDNETLLEYEDCGQGAALSDREKAALTKDHIVTCEKCAKFIICAYALENYVNKHTCRSCA